MRIAIRSFFALAVVVMLTACGGGGDEFLGKWVHAKYSKQIFIEVERNGSSFIISKTRPRFSDGTPQVTQMPAVLKDGMLVANAGMPIAFSVNKNTGELIGEGQVYKRQ